MRPETCLLEPIGTVAVSQSPSVSPSVLSRAESTEPWTDSMALDLRFRSCLNLRIRKAKRRKMLRNLKKPLSNSFNLIKLLCGKRLPASRTVIQEDVDPYTSP